MHATHLPTHTHMPKHTYTHTHTPYNIHTHPYKHTHARYAPAHTFTHTHTTYTNIPHTTHTHTRYTPAHGTGGFSCKTQHGIIQQPRHGVWVLLCHGIHVKLHIDLIKYTSQWFDHVHITQMSGALLPVISTTTSAHIIQQPRHGVRVLLCHGIHVRLHIDLIKYTLLWFDQVHITVIWSSTHYSDLIKYTLQWFDQVHISQMLGSLVPVLSTTTSAHHYYCYLSLSGHPKRAAQWFITFQASEWRSEQLAILFCGWVHVHVHVQGWRCPMSDC